jgi:hypothetical protein
LRADKSQVRVRFKVRVRYDLKTEIIEIIEMIEDRS